MERKENKMTVLLIGADGRIVVPLAQALSDACREEVRTALILSDAINQIGGHPEAIVIVSGVGGTDEMWRETFDGKPDYHRAAARLASHIRNGCVNWGRRVPLVVLLPESMTVAEGNEIFMAIGNHGETLSLEDDVFSLASEIVGALAECKRRQ